jgi:predicted aminopeptidase
MARRSDRFTSAATGGVARRLWPGALAALAGLLAGCQTVEYYSQAVAGQAEVLVKRRPIDQVLAAGSDPRLRERLELTRRLLDFARDELDMPSGGSFELYADLGRDHLVWVLFAAPELSLEPKQWCYPVVGRQDYRGFFREHMVRAEARALEDRGYETWVHEVDAFSTLGWFRDPVLNTFVHREEVAYVELIFHELCHQRYFVRGNTPVNEGIAEAVSREAVRRWYHHQGRPEVAARYQARLGRIAQAAEAIGRTVERLGAVYQEPAPDDWKRRAKAAELERLKGRLERLRAEWNGGLTSWIEGPVNNARLNSFTTYETEVRKFEQLLADCDGKFSEFWRRVEVMDHPAAAD